MSIQKKTKRKEENEVEEEEHDRKCGWTEKKGEKSLTDWRVAVVIVSYDYFETTMF